MSCLYRFKLWFYFLWAVRIKRDQVYPDNVPQALPLPQCHPHPCTRAVLHPRVWPTWLPWVERSQYVTFFYLVLAWQGKSCLIANRVGQTLYKVGSALHLPHPFYHTPPFLPHPSNSTTPSQFNHPTPPYHLAPTLQHPLASYYCLLYF